MTDSRRSKRRRRRKWGRTSRKEWGGVKDGEKMKQLESCELMVQQFGLG